MKGHPDETVSTNKNNIAGHRDLAVKEARTIWLRRFAAPRPVGPMPMTRTSTLLQLNQVLVTQQLSKKSSIVETQQQSNPASWIMALNRGTRGADTHMSAMVGELVRLEGEKKKLKLENWRDGDAHTPRSNDQREKGIR
jgi:hypothetical protein